MTKKEFLIRLKRALGNDLSGAVVQENVEYYSSYIDDEIGKGRSEAEVTAELGEPWAIAKTIVDSVENRGQAYEEYSYEPKRSSGGNGKEQAAGKVHVFGFDTWWKKLFLILGIIGVIVIVVAVIGGIFSLVAPIIMPLLLIWLILRIVGGRRR